MRGIIAERDQRGKGYVEIERSLPSSSIDTYMNGGKVSTGNEAQETASKRSRRSDQDASNQSHTRGSPKTPRRKPDLSLLLGMPLDILYEVFSLFAPKDLLSLTRTSKSFRETLTSPSFIPVWRAARERLDGPDCPLGFSEPRWAALLFDGSNCQCCGKSKVHHIEWTLLRRVCNDCKKTNLLAQSKFKATFPDFDPEIMDFLPYSHVGGWSRGYCSKKKFFWIPDIRRMAQQWTALQQSSQEKLNGFRQERLGIVERISQSKALCLKWVSRQESDRIRASHEASEIRLTAIFDKFKEVGYESRDINSIRFEPSVTRPSPLTDLAWKRVRPSLETIIVSAREYRLEEQRKYLRERWTKTLKALYDDYLRTVAPSRWAYHPSIADILKFPAFEQVMICTGENVTVNADCFADPMVLLPSLIATWMKQRTVDLVAELSKVTEDLPVSIAEDMPADRILGLAIAIFACGRNMCTNDHSPWGPHHANPLFGYGGVSSHMCGERVLQRYIHVDQAAVSIIVASQCGVASASTLVRLAGLDPSCASIAEMDELDPLYFCSGCTPAKSDRGYGRVTYTWRCAVSHIMSNHGHSEDPSWRLLGSEDIKKVEDPPDPVRYDHAWCCSHCPVHFGAWDTRDNVKGHLLTSHGILDADHEGPEDLFYLPSMRRSPMPLLFYKMDGPTSKEQGIIAPGLGDYFALTHTMGLR